MIPTYIILLVSAYCPCEICCGDSANGKTATGRSAYTRGVATDWSVIARGSRIDIPGYKNWALVDDTGGALRAATRRGKIQIDVRFNSHRQALRWGVKTLKCRVWRKREKNVLDKNLHRGAVSFRRHIQKRYPHRGHCPRALEYMPVRWPLPRVLFRRAAFAIRVSERSEMGAIPGIAARCGRGVYRGYCKSTETAIR